MTNEQAITHLWNILEQYEEGSPAWEALQVAIDAVTDKCWAPAEEVLPNTDDYILLSLANFSIPIVGRCETDGEGGTTYYGGDDEEPLTHFDLFVNAWMPLPKPYRPEGEHNGSD